MKISDVEVDQFMREQRNGANAAVAPNINLAQVLVAVPENATEAQVATLQQRAQGVAQRARAGEDFAKLAQEFSDSPDRANGGALGMRSADRYPPLFVEATQSTAVNGIAGPIRSGAGFHVLKVLAKSQPGSADAVVTQTQVRHILLRNDAQAHHARRRWRSWPSSRSASRRARPISPGWRATTRRTAAPRKAATWAGRVPGSSCPSSRKP